MKFLKKRDNHSKRNSNTRNNVKNKKYNAQETTCVLLEVRSIAKYTKNGRMSRMWSEHVPHQRVG